MRRRALTVFAITWIAYATYYLGRKNFGVVKARLTSEAGLSLEALATIGAAYLAAYAVGQFAAGFLGDRIGARRLVAGGLLVSAVACAAFGASSGVPLFLLAYTVDGLAQAAGWPGTNKAIAAWTTRATRGKVMGVWATCYQVGGLAATTLASFVLVRWGWRAAFFVPAACLAVVALIVFLFLEDAPDEPLREPEAKHDEVAPSERSARAGVLRSPAVWSYGTSYFAIKLIRYGLLSWLPFYLRTALHYDEDTSGYLSNAFEIGGIAGTIGLGALSDRVRAVPRAVFAGGSLVLLAPALYAYGTVGGGHMALNFAAMALVGALLFGPDALLSGAAAQDLGGARSAALAVGIVNGVGSVGAIVQEPLTVWITQRWGWGALFHVFVATALLAALALVPSRLARPDPTAGRA